MCFKHVLVTTMNQDLLGMVLYLLFFHYTQVLCVGEGMKVLFVQVESLEFHCIPEFFKGKIYI